MEVSLRVHLDVEVPASQAEDVAAEGPVLRDEVEVISGHADGPGVFGCPEPDEGAPDVASLEFALMGGGLDQPLPRSRRAGGAE